MNPEKVTILNEPKVSTHAVDRNRDARKVDMVPHVKDFVEKHHIFENKKVDISFAQDGVTSLVSIIDAEGEKYVLKIPMRSMSVLGEAKFLKQWENQGVSVPHVIEEGEIDARPYVLMKFIDAKTLGKTYSFDEMVEKEVFGKMGETLSKMHQTESEGYGRLVDGKPEYLTFQDWANSYSMTPERVQEVREQQLVDDALHGSIADAVAILENKIGSNTKTAYCHNDFAPENIFATEPLTVFDPDPIFSHPYLDLGRSIVIAVSRAGTEQAAAQMIDGYFGGQSYDKQFLQAAILFGAYAKFTYWSKTGQKKRIERVGAYLAETKNLLDE